MVRDGAETICIDPPGPSLIKEYKQKSSLATSLIIVFTQNLSLPCVTATSREATGDRDQVSRDNCSRATSQLSGRRARHSS